MDKKTILNFTNYGRKSKMMPSNKLLVFASLYLIQFTLTLKLQITTVSTLSNIKSIKFAHIGIS